MLILPMTNNGARQVSINIITGTFRFETYWNYSTAMWYMDMYDFNGDPYLFGMALVPNINILKAHTIESEDIGDLRIFDPLETGNADVDTLGVKTDLTSWLPGEFEEAFPEQPFELPVTPVDLDDILQ